MASKVFPVKAPEEEVAAWRRAASHAGVSGNAWARDALNSAVSGTVSSGVEGRGPRGSREIAARAFRPYSKSEQVARKS